MKKIYIIILIFINSLLFSETYYLDNGSIVNGVKEDIDEIYAVIKTEHGEMIIKKELIFESIEELNNYKIYWKRHFFDLSTSGGYTISNSRTMGGMFGISIAYMLGLSKYFAYGNGINFNAHFIYYNNSFDKGWIELVEKGSYFTYSFLIYSQFMFGDIRYKKIAFLFDIGYGKLFGTRMGLYYRGLLIKIGYTLNMNNNFIMGGSSNIQLLDHSITFEAGYKFNMGKIKPKS